MGGRFDPARQSSVWPRPFSRVRIVADSATDILPHHARAIGIIVVPNRIILDGVTLRDGIDITPAQFFARLPRLRTTPYTEAAPAEDFFYAYQTAFLQGATDVLSIHVSSRLSEVVAHAKAAREFMAAAPIQIIDSLQAGIGIWPAIIAAAQLARVGASIQDVYNITTSTLARTRIYFLVESLEPLRRSGRIGWARQLLGSLLDIHPILTIRNGEVIPVENPRPYGHGLLRLRDLALDTDQIESLLISGSTIESIAHMESLLAARYRGVIHKTWLGATLGANTGPLIGIAVVTR
ncbi:MAG TPA: DegV family protein [Ktedonobacterales bacterium]|nr:DegV family protein [Ktedonobacterales bacterium]